MMFWNRKNKRRWKDVGKFRIHFEINPVELFDRLGSKVKTKQNRQNIQT